VLVPDQLAWVAALERWHAPRAPNGPLWLRRYGRWYAPSGRHVRAPLELVLGWVAEDEGMGAAAEALGELVGPAAIVDYEPADEWCQQSRWTISQLRASGDLLIP
jgi:hypothetical protein